MTDDTDDTEDKPDLTVVQGSEFNKLFSASKALERDLPFILDGMSAVAKIRRELYTCLKQEGFSAEEALILCQRIEL